MLRKLILPLIGLTLVGVTVWQLLRRDAVAAGPPVSLIADTPRVRAEGKVVSARGAEVVVGVERGGKIARLPVAQGASVKKGDLIAELDSEEDAAAVAEARARMTQAEADLRFAELQLERARRLQAQSAAAADAVDRAEHDRDVASAQRDLAKATARRLSAGLAKTKILSPIDGVVRIRHAEPGEVLPPGAPVATITDLGRTRIAAEIDEFDVARVHVGAEVRISAEGYETSWKGRIAEIPEFVTPRGLRPQDPGHPTDTSVLRVEIIPLETIPLKLGQRAEVDVDVTTQAENVAAR